MSVQQRIRGAQPEVESDGKVLVKYGDVKRKLIWSVDSLVVGLICALTMMLWSFNAPVESFTYYGAGMTMLVVLGSGMLIFLPHAALVWYRYAWVSQKVWWFLSNGAVYLGSAAGGYPNSTDGLTVFVHARKYFPRVQFFWGSAGWHFVKVDDGVSSTENRKSYFSDYAGTRQILVTDWQALEGFGLTKDIRMLLVSSVFLFSRKDWRVETPFGGTILRFVGRRSFFFRTSNDGIVITIAPHDFGLLPEVVSHLCYDTYEGYRNAQRAALKNAEVDVELSWATLASLALKYYERSYQKQKGDRVNSRIRDIEKALEIYRHLAFYLPKGHILRSVHRGTAVLDIDSVISQIQAALDELHAAKSKPEQREGGGGAVSAPVITV